MRSNLLKFALAASFALALAFTISCSSDDDDSSSYTCQLSTGCIQTVNVEDCTIAGGYVVDVCVDHPSSSSGNSSSSSSSIQSGIIPGPSVVHGGETYQTVVIGSQTWFNRNLNYAVGGTCYDDDPDNCAKYGRLYDWATAMALPASCNSSLCDPQTDTKHRGICPKGWHIPSDDDWDVLKDFVMWTLNTVDIGTKLKSKTDWKVGGVPAGTDDYGFAALPGGTATDGIFVHIGEDGYWWSTTESYYDPSNNALGRSISYYKENIAQFFDNKSRLHSIRCLKD